MRTPNPKALVPGALIIAVLVVAVIALVAVGGDGGDGSSASSASAVVPPPITITQTAPPTAPKLTADERAAAKRDQARERAGHSSGDSDEPDADLVAQAPVTTIDGTHGDGALLHAMPAVTPDGWRLDVARLDAARGLTYLTAAPDDGHRTTLRAATAAVRRAAHRLGDDPNTYRATVPRSLLATNTEGTTR